MTIQQRPAIFDEKQINNRLLNTPIRAHVLEECDSTSLHLMRLFKAGNPVHAQAVLALRQTHGRGRQGKSWVAPVGTTVPLSLAWEFDLPAAQLSALPLVVALATWQVLTALDVPAQIKWPNDIVVEQAKLGGILVETLQIGNKSLAIIGIGLNLAAPVLKDQQTLGIWDYAPLCQPNYLVSFLLLALNHALTQFRTHGFSLFKKAYLQANRDLNKPVVLWQGQNILAQGVVEGVDERGALILHTEKGYQYFTSGQISLRSGAAV